MSAAERLYRLGWGTVVFGLPFSNPVMSVGLMLFGTAWILDRVQSGPMPFPRNSTAWGIAAFGASQVLALLWSEDLGAGLQLLRNEGPLFGFALLAATGRWDRAWAERFVPLLLGAAVLLACASMWAYGWWREAQGAFLRPREWSPFVSHVRFSLLVAWTGGWWTLRAFRGQLSALAPCVFAVIGGLTVARTGSLTGLVLLPVAIGGACVLEGRHRAIRAALAVAVGLAFAAGTWAVWELRAVYPDPALLEARTARNGQYRHDVQKTLRENGNFVWTYLCEHELDSAWTARTGAPLTGTDARGQELRTTAIRHLSSLGLRKDADGVDALSEASIQHIQAGIPTVSELEHRGLRRRWDVLAFEWANRRDGGDPSGNSVLQRMEFARAAFHVIRSAPLTGVGTGDVETAMQRAYNEVNSPLDPAYRLRPHNQYLTVWAAAGPGALIAWGLALAGLFSIRGTWRSAARVFALVLALSCMTEDTLESQAGATFAGVFMGLFSGAHATDPARPPRPHRGRHPRPAR